MTRRMLLAIDAGQRDGAVAPDQKRQRVGGSGRHWFARARAACSRGRRLGRPSDRRRGDGTRHSSPSSRKRSLFFGQRVEHQHLGRLRDPSPWSAPGAPAPSVPASSAPVKAKTTSTPGTGFCAQRRPALTCAAQPLRLSVAPGTTRQAAPASRFSTKTGSDGRPTPRATQPGGTESRRRRFDQAQDQQARPGSQSCF